MADDSGEAVRSGGRRSCFAPENKGGCAAQLLARMKCEEVWRGERDVTGSKALTSDSRLSARRLIALGVVGASRQSVRRRVLQIQCSGRQSFMRGMRGRWRELLLEKKQSTLWV